MLSDYTIKYIDLLQEEIELYEWAATNMPSDFDLVKTIEDYIKEHNVELCSAAGLKKAADTLASETDVGEVLVNSYSFNWSSQIKEWIHATDVDKACLFLAKTVNRLILSEDEPPDGINYPEFLNESSVEQDFNSLPLQEIFLRTSSSRHPSIENTSLYSFMSFDLNASYFSTANNEWGDTIDKDKFLRWFLLAKGYGDVSIQWTQHSYTQVGNAELEYDTSLTSNVDITKDVIYFYDGNAKKSAMDGEVFKKNIEPLEKYALEIASISKYSVLDIDIETMLDRASTAASITTFLTSQNTTPEKSISYKLVFNITEQQYVVVPSVDFYQSLLYMKAMGSEKVSLFYDNYEKRIVIRGKDFTQTIERQIIKAGSRIPTVEKEKVTIPTFSIIYEQDIKELTPLSPIEYVQFFDPSLTFRDKYDLLTTKRNAPLDLPEEFVEDYPMIAATYEQQAEVAKSRKSYAEKYAYVAELTEKYLASYTELVKDAKDNFIRKTIELEEWHAPEYVLQVQEAYWEYNKDISPEELLAFFVAKGKDAGYRILCMKILGIDCHLFEQAIISALIDSDDIFVTSIDIDEQNISAHVQYQAKNDFLSGDIYKKEEEISGKNTEGKYNKDLQIFFGTDTGSNIYDKAVDVIQAALSSRFTPSLVPNVRIIKGDKKSEEEAKRLSLNVDLYCPIFFEGQAEAQRTANSPTESVTTILNTGNTRGIDTWNIKWGGNESQYNEFGHFELFDDWLRQHSAEILGDFTYQEIRDSYIFAKSPDKLAIDYILPNFKDKKGNVIGYEVIEDSKKLLPTLMSANDTTLQALKEMGRVATMTEITTQEAQELKKEITIDLKERVWYARNEGRRLFNVFLRKGIDSQSRGLIDGRWNKMFNNYTKPDLLKVPMFPSHNYYFGKKSAQTPFELREAQKEGIRHVLSRENSGLMLHDVGFGKTTSSIAAISSMFNTGQSNRALLLVPVPVYDKWETEIKGNEEDYGLLPNINVVMLDNLKEKSLKKLKKFTKEELEIIVGFRRFDRQFTKIIPTLRRHRVTFPDDPDYLSTSNWDTAFHLIKKEAKKYVPDYENQDIVRTHLEYLQEIYNRVEAEWLRYYSDKRDIIEDYDSTEKQIEAAEKHIEGAKGVVLFSNKLAKQLKQYIKFVAVSLIDDLGYYLPHVMEDNTILIAKHTAAKEALRPSMSATLRALMFREGMGAPQTAEIDSLDTEDWGNIAGLTQSKCKAAVKVQTTHPVSLERLNIDTLLIDEIHNFNNIVKRAGNKGWLHQGSKRYFTSTGYSKRRTKYGVNTYAVLERTSGRSNQDRYDMKYDGVGRVSDIHGKLLSTAALCFDIQYKSPNKKNVLLLSATPFTDTPFQVLSVLGMANYQMLADNGINDAWDFFNQYVDETYKYSISHDGGYGLFIDIDNYYNDKALSNLITNVTNVKITDEQIEAQRPLKAVIPQNKIAEDTEGNVAATELMGDYFDELVSCNSRVEMSKEQKKFYDTLREYLKDDDDQRPVKEIFPINEKRDSGLDNETIDREVEALVKEKIKEATEDKDMADMIVTYLQSNYDAGKYALHPQLQEAIDYINQKILKEGVEKPEEEDLEGAIANIAQMSRPNLQKGKAIGSQKVQQSLVISPYLVNLGSPTYTSTYLSSLEPNPSKVFVETSPKLMYVVGAIEQAIAYQQTKVDKGELEKVGSQIVYFNTFKFSYGGKEYNAFDLLAEYIANNVKGISSDKIETQILDKNGNVKSEHSYHQDIGIISGDTKDKDLIYEDEIARRGKETTRDQFNRGEVKVLLGSKAIKEGIDLQGNTHTLYICESEFSPEVAMQIEGRAWRQKNPYDVVRIIYVLMMNTIDSFIYSKINKKVNQIKKMLEQGVYEMNTTQFTMDTKEMLMQLLTDADQLTQIQFQDEKIFLKTHLANLDKEIDKLKVVKEKYEDTEFQMKAKLPHLTKLYGLISDAKVEMLKDKYRKIIKKQLSALSIQEKENAKYKGNMKAWLNEKKNKGKYTPSVKDVDEMYKEEVTERPELIVMPKLRAPLTTGSLFSEIENAVAKVNAHLRQAESVENIWRRADAKEQKEIKDKKVKSAAERYWMAYVEVMWSKEDESMPDLAAYMRSLTSVFVDNPEGIMIMETYQGEVVAAKDGKGTLADIDSIIAKTQKLYDKDAGKLLDEDAFKESIRQAWVKALAAKREDTDLSLSGLIKTLKTSLPLLKIR